MKTRLLTLMALLAAVYAVSSLLPGFPMIGVPGSKIDLARSLEIGYGFILGPLLSPPTAFLGAIVGKTLSGGGVGLFFTPLAFVSPLVSACLSRKKVYNMTGWKIAAFTLTLLILGWYLTTTGRKVPLYPVLHLLALGVILLFRGRLADYLNGDDKARLTLGAMLAGFPATMAGHMLGNLIFILLFSPEPLFFMSILPISAIERMVLTAIGTVIAVPLIIAVRTLLPEILR